uniref:Uncharacterized protein n=1 Tax=Chromera velia CCMP2878 TaxID=1169474 RepID=A0A0G4HMU8_9ALVE|eukprot:Cvel_29424.t1-p1 / transcript=Cvel_29424.t1 / gene=Cvel_29424 / organism=Chromera_velia_CCMP2878 / gene_product=hypothetical protein / transcript_product=hypothetical protein / location=Cvel_scaffold4018:11119-11523(+) / protein_length=135 / sequence_SO=supercontig / SO=protein_coding / is_pseudo=false
MVLAVLWEEEWMRLVEKRKRTVGGEGIVLKVLPKKRGPRKKRQRNFDGFGGPVAWHHQRLLGEWDGGDGRSSNLSFVDDGLEGGGVEQERGTESCLRAKALSMKMRWSLSHDFDGLLLRGGRRKFVCFVGFVIRK